MYFLDLIFLPAQINSDSCSITEYGPLYFSFPAYKLMTYHFCKGNFTLQACHNFAPLYLLFLTYVEFVLKCPVNICIGAISFQVRRPSI